jgi:hypothetical protein
LSSNFFQPFCSVFFSTPQTAVTFSFEFFSWISAAKLAASS